MTSTIIRRKRKNRKRRHTVVFRATRITALLPAAINFVDRTLLTLAIYSGLRLGELLGLRWADLELPPRGISMEPLTSADVANKTEGD